MLEPDGSPQHGAHAEPGAGDRDGGGRELAAEGVLADVAPTVLGLLGVAQPEQMTGGSLIVS